MPCNMSATGGNLVPDIYMGLMGALVGAGVNGPELGDDKASGAGAAKVAASRGLVREIGVKVQDL